MWKFICTILALVCYLQTARNVAALDNGLALTPPMGWMSWQRYRCIVDCNLFPDECISERLFKNVADYLVSFGYKDAGYEYVVVDDCWMEKERDNVTQELVPDRKRFPSGMKALADYIHGKGLKFGIYQNYGPATCRGYPGTSGHMEIDVKTFAKWEADYIAGRPMVFSCGWAYYSEDMEVLPNYEQVKKYCNLWRNFVSIRDSFQFLNSVTEYFAVNQSRIQPHAGPGHWNDPDELLIGNYGLTIDQSKTQMAIWAILAAPLFMSNDLKNIRNEFSEILLNRQIIAVNQDELGIQGKRIMVMWEIETWIRPITPIVNGSYSYAVAWASKRNDGCPYLVNTTLFDSGLNHSHGYIVTDLFDANNEYQQIYQPKLNFTIRIIPSGAVFFKFTPVDKDVDLTRFSNPKIKTNSGISKDARTTFYCHLFPLFGILTFYSYELFIRK